MVDLEEHEVQLAVDERREPRRGARASTAHRRRTSCRAACIARCRTHVSSARPSIPNPRRHPSAAPRACHRRARAPRGALVGEVALGRSDERTAGHPPPLRLRRGDCRDQKPRGQRPDARQVGGFVFFAVSGIGSASTSAVENSTSTDSRLVRGVGTVGVADGGRDVRRALDLPARARTSRTAVPSALAGSTPTACFITCAERVRELGRRCA